jgi:hypothetical protein
MGNDPSPGLGCDVHKASIAVAMIGKGHHRRHYLWNVTGFMSSHTPGQP